MMLLYFAWVRQKLGKSEETLALPPGVQTVQDLADHLRQRGGAYAEIFAGGNTLRAAVNQEHVPFAATIADSDEIAFFPPVTGG